MTAQFVSIGDCATVYLNEAYDSADVGVLSSDSTPHPDRIALLTTMEVHTGFLDLSPESLCALSNALSAELKRPFASYSENVRRDFFAAAEEAFANASSVAMASDVFCSSAIVEFSPTLLRIAAVGHARVDLVINGKMSAAVPSTTLYGHGVIPREILYTAIGQPFNRENVRQYEVNRDPSHLLVLTYERDSGLFAEYLAAHMVPEKHRYDVLLRQCISVVKPHSKIAAVFS